jgi:hypothetical protein
VSKSKEYGHWKVDETLGPPAHIIEVRTEKSDMTRYRRQRNRNFGAVLALPAPAGEFEKQN